MRASWLILDDTGTPITGAAASTSIKIRRLSDGYLFDWNDNTFKNSGWVSLSSTIPELDSTNLPGWYEKVVSELGWIDGGYQLITAFDNGSVKRFGSSECEVKEGEEVVLRGLSDLSVVEVIKACWSRAVIDKLTGDFTIYDLDKITPLVTGVVNVDNTQSERIPD